VIFYSWEFFVNVFSSRAGPDSLNVSIVMRDEIVIGLELQQTILHSAISGAQIRASTVSARRQRCLPQPFAVTSVTLSCLVEGGILALILPLFLVIPYSG
jgi:hypothetical protein